MAWEGPITPSEANVVVGAASTLLAAANADRRWLLIANRSDEMVDVKLGEAAVAGEGIPINPIDASNNIQGVFESSEKNCNLYKGAVYGICASGGKTVSVYQGS